jgi:L-arabinose isomerase
MKKDRQEYICEGIAHEVHKTTTKAGLAIRRWIEEEKLDAFTINFLKIDKNSGLPCMPFLEACKAMARGTGYAGEGDILTAALVGALLKVYPQITFAEMFCPDWKNNRIFLSHMGEMNLALAGNKPRMTEYDFSFTDAKNPMVAYAGLMGGEAVFVNLAPLGDGKYTLIYSLVDMLEISGEDKMQNSIHGWFEPSISIADYLERYSILGGTHHAALVYSGSGKEIDEFGKMMGWDVVRI